MKMIFLYMSQSSAAPGRGIRYTPVVKRCHLHYDRHFSSEGYFSLLQRLVDDGTLTDLKIFFESNVGPGLANWVIGKNVHCEVIPEIRFVDQFVQEDTIIWVRGGFKHWHDWLMKYKGKNWLMLYAANTGREKWTFWDIILNDLYFEPGLDSYGRYWHNWKKPINEAVFYPQKELKVYDFCIGASHIHDRKGQWKAFEAFKNYNNREGVEKIKAIMPGVPRGGARTREMMEEVLTVENISTPGFVSRDYLRRLFNQSRFFIHMGAHGQNDRGPLEAMACGTPVIIATPERHAPFLVKNSRVVVSADNPQLLASQMQRFIAEYDEVQGRFAYAAYCRESSFEDVIVPDFKRLLNLMVSNGPPTIKNKIKIEGALREDGEDNRSIQRKFFCS